MTRNAASPLVASVVLTAWLALASFAFAAETVTVRAGDLDLNTEAGAKTLIGRIDAAATQACWPDQLDRFVEFQACHDGMMLQAVKLLNKPLVALVYAETYPNTERPIVIAGR